MGVTEDRRRMIASQPHLVSASGEELGINVAEPKINKLDVSYLPVQTGSGTPSPSNPRPVVGWSSIPVSFVPGTDDVLAAVPDGVYGTVDLSTGIMTVTHQTIIPLELSNLTIDSVRDGIVNFCSYNLTNGGARRVKNSSNALSNMLVVGTGSISGTMVLYANQAYFVLSSDIIGGTTLAAVKAWLGNHSLVACTELETSYTIQLSGITPRTGTVTISPFQQGGGTASPTNLRPIIPVADGASIDLGSRSIAGNIDLVSGTGLATWNAKENGWSDSAAFSSFTKSGDNRIFWVYLGGLVYNDETPHILSDQYTFAGYNYNYAGVPVYSMCGSPDYVGSLWVKVPASDLPTDNLAGAQAFFQQTLPRFYWPRTAAGRTPFNLPSQTILAPRGQQTVSSPAGEIEISYWTQETYANLYTGGDLTFSRMTQIPINLPVGTYRFTAAVTSTDTDDADCLVLPLDASEQGTTSDQYIVRSTNGETHSVTFTTTAASDRIGLYAARKWSKTSGDTASYSKIRLERIG